MSTKLLHRVRSLVERGERISAEDCAALFEVKDLIALSKLARVPRERRHGTSAFFSTSSVVEYRGGEPERFVEEAATSIQPGANSILVRMAWGNAEPLDEWTPRLRAFSRASLPVIALVDAPMIDRLAAAWGVPVARVIASLNEAGSIGIGGTGAEIFDPTVRATISGTIASEEWLAVHRAAHVLGMKTSASISYGVHDHASAYAAHLQAIRALQDETGGFDSFTPLAVHNRHPEARHLAVPTAAQSLRMTAIARIFLDNVPHVGAAPALVGTEVAVVALGYGADTIESALLPSDVLLQDHAGPLGELAVIDEPARVAIPSPESIRARLIEAKYSVSGVGFLVTGGVRS